ncbi:DUF2927 domain-containing protein [Pseudogemmobacter sonorensis]|uniref:DUF2927 domain-containing protein n=1 Tax=Pseudogemmobacter sonorensis TaxID=2989681 RepID=UPI0036C513CA
MRKYLLLAAIAATSACAPGPGVEVTKSGAAQQTTASALPRSEAFLDPGPTAALSGRGGHSNADLAADFMELGFALESGRALKHFSRFEGTVTVAMTGAVPASAPAEMTRLLNRLRTEAGIDIRPARPGETASITVEFSPKSALRQAAANAACFVVPNVATLADYRASRGQARLDWANVAQRQQVGIFAPSDGAPQEIRDCLHEELAQALGPLNDLYRLTDTVFNDDNFHSVLTATDMKILRAWYAPELASGMTREEVGARIGAVIARVNGGGAASRADLSATPRVWINAIEQAVGGGSMGARRSAAERALSIAQAQGWKDGRMAFSHFALARLHVASDRARAVEEFTRAAAIYRGLPGGAIHVAHIDMQLAAIAVASGQPEQALRFADRAIPAARAAENHALVASSQLIKAEALDLMGRGAEAAALRLDSRPLASYGFGSEIQVNARMREIAALGALGPRG